MNYLFMTQSHHDVTSLDIVMFFSLEISTLTRADIVVLVILLAGVKMFLSRRDDILADSPVPADVVLLRFCVDLTVAGPCASFNV
jgi:hypothetical protein